MIMATRVCDVCGVRPAVVAVRRRIPGEGQTVQYLCELHAAEARVGRPPQGASSLGGGSLFDDFFDRFFDEGRSALPGGGTALRRRAEQVDVTQFFSAATTD
jgi:ATP-dependent Clp protease ATP-binding subunit ClpC